MCPVVLSDGSVTCACIDYDKKLVLGDVHHEDLGDIWRGQRLQSVRQLLLSGKLPSDKCAYCWNLVELSQKSGAPEVQPLRSVLVENTVRCCYRCAGCPIDSAGSSRSKSVVDFEEMRGILRQLRDLRIQRVGFYNYGEPFLDRDFAAKLRLARDMLGEDVVILTSTNGSLLDSPEKRQAAADCLDLIVFSIHGADERSLRRYQRAGSFERAYGNMLELSRLRRASSRPRLKIEWKYLLFHWTSGLEMLQGAAALAEAADVDLLYFSPAYQPPEGVCVHSLSAWERGEPLHGRYPHLPDYGFIGHQKEGYEKWRAE